MQWKFDSYQFVFCLHFNSDVSLSVVQFSKSYLLGGSWKYRPPCGTQTLLPREQNIFHAGKTVPDPRHSSNASTPFTTTPLGNKKTNKQTNQQHSWFMPKTLTYLLKLVGFGLILVPVCILSVSHPEPPHRQDAVDVVPYPSILMVCTS